MCGRNVAMNGRVPYRLVQREKSLAAEAGFNATRFLLGALPPRSRPPLPTNTPPSARC